MFKKLRVWLVYLILPTADIDDIIELQNSNDSLHKHVRWLKDELRETKVKVSILRDVDTTTARIRKQYPAVQDAWEQYRIMYRLHI